MSGWGIIELPWPPKELHPNARVHHLTKARAAKAYRETSYWIAYDFSRRLLTDTALVELHETDRDVILSLMFNPPDRRRRDLDGMLSSIKAGLDGVADALAVDDNRFGFNLRRSSPVKGGRVVIVVGEAA